MTGRVPDWRAIAAAYDAGAAGYDARHGDRRSERRFRIIDAPQLRAARGAARVLELGCGTGRLLARVRAPVRVGVDVSREMLRHARARALPVVLADAHRLPFAGSSFDVILAGKGTFRYLDHERAFAECARVLGPGGRLGVHQYAARTWSPRAAIAGIRSVVMAGPAGSGPVDDALPVRDLRHAHELYGPARRAGLDVEATHLWRSVRVPPYALPVPAWIPGRWWSHCTVIFRKRSAAEGSSWPHPS